MEKNARMKKDLKGRDWVWGPNGEVRFFSVLVQANGCRFGSWTVRKQEFPCYGWVAQAQDRVVLSVRGRANNRQT